MSQKSEMKELISKWNNQGYQILFYPKFYCEHNYIEHFWTNAKQYTQDHCDYILERLRKRVPEALTSVRSHTILRHYKSYLKKIDLYRESIGYAIKK